MPEGTYFPQEMPRSKRSHNLLSDFNQSPIVCEEKGEVNFASRFLQNDFSLARSWVEKAESSRK